MSAPVTLDAMMALPMREARKAFMTAYWTHHMTLAGNDVRKVAETVDCDRAHVYYAFKQAGYALPKKGAK